MSQADPFRGELDEVFSADELASMKSALSEVREPGAYEEGRWNVSRLNPRQGSKPRPRVVVRDIAMRTIEQLPGVRLDAEQRLRLIRALVEVGVPEVTLSAFGRGHGLEDMRRELDLVKSINPACRVTFANAVREDDMDLARDARIDRVEVWSAVFLGKAMPASAGAVYHRWWQGKDWRTLNFPPDVATHMERISRLAGAGLERGLDVIAVMNLSTFASEEYAETFAGVAAASGASQVVIADSTGGLGPEATTALVSAAKRGAPDLSVAIHAHNAFGLGVANSVAALQAGADTVEVAVNGLEVGPGGVQTSLAPTVAAFEALYGYDTGIDLTQMTRLSQLAAEFTGYEIPWSEPIVGSGTLQVALPDEYVMELKFDPLLHASITPEAVGSQREWHLGMTSGPFGLVTKARELGFELQREQVADLLRKYKQEVGAGAVSLTDRRFIELIRTVV